MGEAFDSPVADFYATAHTHTPAYMNGVYYPLAREGEVLAGTFTVRVWSTWTRLSYRIYL